MNAWDTVLGQRALESINYIASDVNKIGRNYPTLRDQFAMACLQGLVADSTFEQPTKEDYAAICYQFADAMLAERSKEN